MLTTIDIYRSWWFPNNSTNPRRICIPHPTTCHSGKAPSERKSSFASIWRFTYNWWTPLVGICGGCELNSFAPGYPHTTSIRRRTTWWTSRDSRGWDRSWFSDATSCKSYKWSKHLPAAHPTSYTTDNSGPTESSSGHSRSNRGGEYQAERLGYMED